MRRVALFIHGFNSSPEAWGDLLRELSRSTDVSDDWSLRTFEYPGELLTGGADSLAPPVRQIARGLRTEIESSYRDASEIALVGHSLGGLVARTFLIEEMKRRGANLDVSRVMLVATPNEGSELAGLGTRVFHGNKQLRQLLSGSDFLSSLNSDWANLDVESDVYCRFVVAGGDEVVGGASARGRWGDDNVDLVLGRGHFDVIRPGGADDIVVGLVERFLESSVPEARVLPDPDSLVDRFRERLDQINEEMNELIPGGVYSPRHEEEKEVFRSERILTSLVEMGMPIRLAVEVVENVSDPLRERARAEETFTTRDIRQAVWGAIYSLGRDGRGSSAVETWASMYARRYGNPDRRLMVSHPDDGHTPLDYSYLDSTVVPGIFKDVTGASLPRLPDGMVSRGERDEMSREIMMAVKGIPAYTITEGALRELAVDIALEPPHPWLVGTCFMSDTVTYDLERASFWIDRVAELIGERDRRAAVHAVVEVLEHAASAWLGFYGSFLGATYLGSLDQLNYQLQSLVKGACETTWSYFRVDELPEDVERTDRTFHDVAMRIGQIRKRSRSLEPGSVGSWHDDATWFHRTVRDVIEDRIDRMGSHLILT